MSVTAYLHLEEAGENVCTCLSDKLGQSMYREGIIFWERRFTLELSHLLFERRPASTGNRDGGVWSRLLGRDDREMRSSISGKEERQHERAVAFQQHRPPAVTTQGEHLEERQLHNGKHLTDFTISPMRCFHAAWQVTLSKPALTHHMKSADDLLFVLSPALGLIHILPGE